VWLTAYFAEFCSAIGRFTFIWVAGGTQVGKSVQGGRRGLSGWLAAALVLSGLFFQNSFDPSIDAAEASGGVNLGTCAANGVSGGGVTIQPSHGKAFYIDTGQGQDINAGYVGYRITASSTLTDVKVVLSDFTGGVIGLANPLDATNNLGIVSSTVKAAYFFLKAPRPTTTPQGHKVTVYNGSTALASCTYTFERVRETIKAAANKVKTITVQSAAQIGGNLVITHAGETGTIGAGSTPDFDTMWLSPASNVSWPTSALKLSSVSVEYKSKTNKTRTINDSLILENARRGVITSGEPPKTYIATYTFKIIGRGIADIKPVAQISSGTQMKHTDMAAATYPKISFNTSTAPVNVRVTKSS
jgi:hypothetical protein